MERIERTELFGRHVISATARTSPDRGGARMWEVDVVAVALGSAPDEPLLRFSPPQLTPGDPSASLEAAVERARRALA